jgi:hypothetical protein
VNNQFSKTIAFNYDIPVVSSVFVSIYTMLGREIYRLRLASKEPGRHELEWDGLDKLGDPVSDTELIVRIETISVNGGERRISARKLMLYRNSIQ